MPCLNECRNIKAKSPPEPAFRSTTSQPTTHRTAFTIQLDHQCTTSHQPPPNTTQTQNNFPSIASRAGRRRPRNAPASTRYRLMIYRDGREEGPCRWHRTAEKCQNPTDRESSHNVPTTNDASIRRRLPRTLYIIITDQSIAPFLLSYYPVPVPSKINSSPLPS